MEKRTLGNGEEVVKNEQGRTRGEGEGGQNLEILSERTF